MIVGIIPARYDSSRFPGKPLIDLNGKSMIQRVYEQSKKSKTLDRVIVATDDQRIFDAVKEFGGEVEMTSKSHPSGTDRCQEISSRHPEFSIIINIQGDEPLIDPAEIDRLANMISINKNVEIGTLIKVMNADEIDDPNRVKVTISKKGKALYFSRSKIPFERSVIDNHSFFQHIGIYGYTQDALDQICQLKPSSLELIEGLEQLRWLENDFNIYTEKSDFQSIAIDSPEDVEKVLKHLL